MHKGRPRRSHKACLPCECEGGQRAAHRRQLAVERKQLLGRVPHGAQSRLPPEARPSRRPSPADWSLGAGRPLERDSSSRGARRRADEWSDGKARWRHALPCSPSLLIRSRRAIQSQVARGPISRRRPLGLVRQPRRELHGDFDAVVRQRQDVEWRWRRRVGDPDAHLKRI